MTTVAEHAWAVRKQNFPAEMEFYAPGLKRWQTAEWIPSRPDRFRAVSVTGSACALQCDHCGAKVLEGMISVRSGENLFDVARSLAERGSEGILVSGGSTRKGGVPLAAHLRYVPRIKSELGMKVVVHCGVADERLAEAIAASGADAVMLDVIGADETIRDVYHLALKVEDFDRALALLAAQGLRIIPHIVLGLHYGTFLGEHRALEMVGGYPVSTLILVVLVPLVGTPMSHLPPPPTEDVIEFFETARLAMPETKINLGCARPMAGVKRTLDRAAIDLGLNGIAYPAEGAIEYARSKGLRPKLYEWCCSMSWAGDAGENLVEVKVGEAS
ncbi:MAG TPA: radical SAM protein [Candidatus Dormibacteraeota bacterium]|nr:radical SAM protein [Candidatus Dormibacteraeota bacterium]